MVLLIVPVIVVVMMLLGRNHAGAAQILGSLPIGVVGLAFRDEIKGPVLRSLTTVGIALIAWSAVMVRAARLQATEKATRAEETA